MKSKEDIAKELDLIWCRAGRTKEEALLEMGEYVRELLIEARIEALESVCSSEDIILINGSIPIEDGILELKKMKGKCDEA